MIFPEKSAEGELARGGLRRAPKDKVQDDDSRYYDENGNHLYYDRKLIARLEKEQERAAQQNK